MAYFNWSLNNDVLVKVTKLVFRDLILVLRSH